LVKSQTSIPAALPAAMAAPSAVVSVINGRTVQSKVLYGDIFSIYGKAITKCNIKGQQYNIKISTNYFFHRIESLLRSWQLFKFCTLLWTLKVHYCFQKSLQLTPWSGVLLQWLPVTPLIKIFCPFIKPDDSLSSLQEVNTGPVSK
jgi:hypothetical protein